MSEAPVSGRVEARRRLVAPDASGSGRSSSRAATPPGSTAPTGHVGAAASPSHPGRPGVSVTFVIEAQVQGSVGAITNTATLTSSTFDPVAANNTNAAHPGHEGRHGPQAEMSRGGA